MSRKEKKIMEKITYKELTAEAIELVTADEEQQTRAKAIDFLRETIAAVKEYIKDEDKHGAKRKMDFLSGVLTAYAELDYIDLHDVFYLKDELREQISEMK